VTAIEARLKSENAVSIVRVDQIIVIAQFILVRAAFTSSKVIG